MNYSFEKKFSGGSLCTRGAAGIWAVDLFSATYFDEIIISTGVRSQRIDPPYLTIPKSIQKYFSFS
jgi:hypothetical protein